MKQATIITAYQAVERIRQDINEKKNIPSNISYVFYRLYKLFQPQVEFQEEEEKKLFETYKPEFTQEGILRFEKEEDGNAWLKKINELSDMDVDLKFEKIKFKIDENSFLTTDDMLALDEFLDFYEE